MITVRGRNYYKPSEVTKTGLLKSATFPHDPIKSTESILRLIRERKLRVRSFPEYHKQAKFISEDEILRYNNEIEKIK